MLVCSICADALPFSHPCYRAHEDLCHACWDLSMRGNAIEAMPHPAPQAPPTLTPRAQAAVAAYQAHVVRVMGAAPLVELVTEEDD